MYDDWDRDHDELTELPSLLQKRPDFGNTQIRELAQLRGKKGSKVCFHWRGGGTRTCKIVGEPFFEGGTWWVKVKGSLGGEEESLEDAGVVAYESGLWNATNWVEFV